jgi:hypothetical protein
VTLGLHTLLLGLGQQWWLHEAPIPDLQGGQGDGQVIPPTILPSPALWTPVTWSLSTIDSLVILNVNLIFVHSEHDSEKP